MAANVLDRHTSGFESPRLPSFRENAGKGVQEFVGGEGLALGWIVEGPDNIGQVHWLLDGNSRKLASHHGNLHVDMTADGQAFGASSAHVETKPGRRYQVNLSLG